jgi:NADPH:quinone reductase-like Zn-dependent oxidoreductase
MPSRPRERRDTVKAIVQDVYGSADVLELGDVDKPAPTDDEVLLRVHAAGVGPDVWHLVTGLPYLMRVMGYGLRRPKTRVRGWDVAGRVESVGKNVKGLRAGDEVYGTCNGSFAEYASARADRIAPKPANLDFEQAAAVPISGQTALQGLRDAARVKPGDSVLVIGAAGGVGTFAVQIAKAFGSSGHWRLQHEEGGPGPIDRPQLRSSTTRARTSRRAGGGTTSSSTPR